ncbi:MAG: hypothetical protein ACTS5I_11115, partial [Rhodanobacter sp.]
MVGEAGGDPSALTEAVERGRGAGNAFCEGAGGEGGEGAATISSSAGMSAEGAGGGGGGVPGLCASSLVARFCLASTCG